MDYNTITDADKHYLSHHGVKGQMWGVRNLETLFKYGLTSISPAAAKADGGFVDATYRQALKERLEAGELTPAEATNLKMQRIIANWKAKGNNAGASGRSSNSKGKEDAKSSAEPSDTVKKQMEALLKARNEAKEEKEEKTKSSKSGSGGKGGSGSKGKGGGGGKGGKGSKEKEYELDIDEGPMDYTKSNYFKQLNASKKGKRLRMQRSVTNRSGSTHVQKRGRSLKKRLYHSAMVAKLKGEFLDER